MEEQSTSTAGFKFDKKTVIGLIGLLVLLSAIPIGVYLSQQRQIFKPKASEVNINAGPETSFTLDINKPSPIQIGDEIKISISAKSDLFTANLFAAKLHFPQDLIQVKKIEVAPEGGFVKNWTETTFDNSNGTVSVVGGIPDPGYQSIFDPANGLAYQGALMADVVFTAIATGSATISFDPESAIYQNSDNTNILNTKRDTNFQIKNDVNKINISTSCSGTILNTSVSGDIFSPSDRNFGLWSTLTDGKTGQSMIYEFDGNQGSATIHIAANFPATGAIRGSSIPVVGDGRTYTVSVYAAPFNSGTPSLISPLVQSTFSYNCASPSPTPTPSSVSGPVITSIFPLNVEIGDTVRIVGQNLLPKGVDVTTLKIWLVHDDGGVATIASVSPREGDPLWENGAITFKIGNFVPQSGQLKVIVGNKFANAPNRFTIGSKGDINADGKISLVDMSSLFSRWGKTGDAAGKTDINADGVVNTFDYSLMIQILIQNGVIKGS